MKKIRFIVIAIAITSAGLYSSCRTRHSSPGPPPINYTNVPDGGTYVFNGGDLTNRGLLINRSATTWIIRGNVIMDDLSVEGKVIVDPASTLTVHGTLTVGGGAHFQNLGQVTCTNFTQTGDVFLNGSNTTITNQFTVGGGTTTYFQNSKVNVRDLRIIGAIVGLQNDATQNGNVYSVIHFTSGAYLNRGGGTKVCGPVLFTYNGDMGGSGVAMSDVTTAALNAKSNLRTIYGLPDATFYQWNDQNCAPQAVAPGF